jgi:hypothetical protein
MKYSVQWREIKKTIAKLETHNGIQYVEYTLLNGTKCTMQGEIVDERTQPTGDEIEVATESDEYGNVTHQIVIVY